MEKVFFVFGLNLLIGLNSLGQYSELKLDNDEIIIPIGNSVIISAETVNQNLTNFKILDKSKVTEAIDMMQALNNIEKDSIVSNELEFKFCHADFMGSKLVVLTSTHHLEKPILFKAKIRIRGHKKFIKTSIVVKYPNVFSVEQWQDDIDTIILYDFKFIEE